MDNLEFLKHLDKYYIHASNIIAKFKKMIILNF